MAKIKYLFPNLIYAAEITGPEGGWLEGDLSLAALYDPVLGHPARSVDADPANTQIVIALDRRRPVGGVILSGHNLTTSAKIILQGARDAAFSDVAHNPEGLTVEAFPRLFRTRDLPWSAANWFLGRPLAEEIGNTTTQAIILFPRSVTVRYWRILIVDPDNPDGFVEVGKVILGPSFDPAHNYGYGASLSVLDESRMTQSLGGTRYFDKRGKRRRFAFGFEYLEEKAEFAKHFDFVSRAGITEEAFVIPDPADLRNLQRRSFCATLREASALEQAVYLRFNISHVVEEQI